MVNFIMHINNINTDYEIKEVPVNKDLEEYAESVSSCLVRKMSDDIAREAMVSVIKASIVLGAQWQQNHVWHDIREKPDMRKFVVFSDGKKTMTPPLRNPFDDYPMLIDVANRKYGGGYKVWAYPEDLLPNVKEDRVKIE